jgi:hypothetical protein
MRPKRHFVVEARTRFLASSRGDDLVINWRDTMTTLSDSALPADRQPPEEYRYYHFSLPLMLRDLHFSESALRPGEVAPTLA